MATRELGITEEALIRALGLPETIEEGITVHEIWMMFGCQCAKTTIQRALQKLVAQGRAEYVGYREVPNIVGKLQKRPAYRLKSQADTV